LQNIKIQKKVILKKKSSQCTSEVFRRTVKTSSASFAKQLLDLFHFVTNSFRVAKSPFHWNMQIIQISEIIILHTNQSRVHDGINVILLLPQRSLRYF